MAKKEKEPFMKWSEMTPQALDGVAQDLYDHAHDLKVEREALIEYRGFDVVAATDAVGRRLQREATRRTQVITEVKVEGEGWHVVVTYDGTWLYDLCEGTERLSLGKQWSLAGLLWILVERLLPTKVEEDDVTEKLDAAVPALLALRRSVRRQNAAALNPPSSPTLADLADLADQDDEEQDEEDAP